MASDTRHFVHQLRTQSTFATVLQQQLCNMTRSLYLRLNYVAYRDPWWQVIGGRVNKSLVPPVLRIRRVASEWTLCAECNPNAPPSGHDIAIYFPDPGVWHHLTV